MARRAGTTDDDLRGEAGGSTSQDGSIPIVDPIQVDAAAASAGEQPDNSSADNAGGNGGTEGRKRTRRTKEQLIADGYYEGKDVKPARATGKAGSLDVNTIQFSLTGIHAVLASAFSAPELILDETEAAKVSQAAVAVMRHYDMQASQKAVDWGNLVVTLGVVYGGRLVRIGARRRAQRNQDLASRTGFESVAAAVVPASPQRPPAPRANGASAPAPSTRPKTDKDLEMLNEVEPAMF